MAVEHESSTLAEAYANLAQLVRDWRAAGRTTTTAGLKPALGRLLGGFNEREYGFASFREFVGAAETAGFVTLAPTPSGHWLVLLPGEDPGLVPAPRSQATEGEIERLTPHVWAAFVEWGNNLDRKWDRDESEPVVYPVGDDGQPAWITQPDRFCSLEPADQSTQISWMREWARTLPDPQRDTILASLDDAAPPGAFRQALGELSLVSAWRTELRKRVVDHVRTWASVNRVALGDLLDSRPQPQPARDSVPHKAYSRRGAPPDRESHSPREEIIRRRLHEVVDRMTVSELAELRIPFRVLVEDQFE